MGVVDRARQRMPASGDYLDKDELIRNQDEPFGIKSCIYDDKGSSFGPRWVLSIVPWFEDQDDPQGLLTFGANPTRNPMFEDFQAQIEENGSEPIGPVVLVKDKSQKGYRFYTLADWSETPKEDVPAPAARHARPSASASTATAASQPTEVTPEAIPANGNGEVKRRPGRPRKNQATGTAALGNSASTATEVRPAAVETVVAQVATPDVATVICPDCKQEVTGRVLPDDKGKHFVIHPFCPTLGKASIVEVVV